MATNYGDLQGKRWSIIGAPNRIGIFQAKSFSCRTAEHFRSVNGKESHKRPTLRNAEKRMKRVPKSLTSIFAACLIGISTGIVATPAQAHTADSVSRAITNVVSQPSANQIKTFIGNADGSLMYPTSSPEAWAIIESLNPVRPIAPTAGPVPVQAFLHAGGIVEPYITIGAGWYLYVYLNSGDINWLLGMGFTAASAALCLALVPTGIGAVACAVVAYVVWSVIQAYAGVNKPGYCLEISMYWGTFALHDVKWVQRNC